MTDHSTLLAKLDLWARSHRERGLPESADLMIAARDAIVELQGTKLSQAEKVWRAARRQAAINVSLAAGVEATHTIKCSECDSSVTEKLKTDSEGFQYMSIDNMAGWCWSSLKWYCPKCAAEESARKEQA